MTEKNTGPGAEGVAERTAGTAGAAGVAGGQTSGAAGAAGERAVGRSVVLRAALRLYPADYRRERGDEIAAVVAENTVGAGPVALVREAADLAAYGLRLRLGLTATSPGGRLATLAAPLVAGGLAGMDAYGRLGNVHLARYWLTTLPPETGWPLVSYLAMRALLLLPLLLAGALLLGRWKAARAVAVAMVAVALADVVQQGLHHGSAMWWIGFAIADDLPALLAGLLVLAVPSDVEDPRSRLVRGGAVVGATAGGVVLGSFQGGYSLYGDRSGAGFMLAAFALLAVSVWRGWAVPAAVALAALPLTIGFGLNIAWDETGGGRRTLPMVALLGLVMVVAAVAGLRRGAEPKPARGGDVRAAG